MTPIAQDLCCFVFPCFSDEKRTTKTKIMRQLLLSLCCLFLFTAATAQTSFFSKYNWKLKRVGAFMGQDQDMLNTMNHDYFLSSLRNTTDFNFSDINATERHAYSMLCENPHFRLNATFQNQQYPNIEAGISLVGIFARIDEVEYATPGSHLWSEDRQSLRFTQYGNELAIEPTLSYRSQRGAWALSGTLGVNAGYTFANTLDIYGQNITICDNNVTFRDELQDDTNCETIAYLYEYGTQSNGASMRAFAEIDASFTIRQRLEMGMMVRRGQGVRFTNNAPTVGTNLHSGGVYMRWVIR